MFGCVVEFPATGGLAEDAVEVLLGHFVLELLIGLADSFVVRLEDTVEAADDYEGQNDIADLIFLKGSSKYAVCYLPNKAYVRSLIVLPIMFLLFSCLTLQK